METRSQASDSAITALSLENNLRYMEEDSTHENISAIPKFI
jgi:hypothetical protein